MTYWVHHVLPAIAGLVVWVICLGLAARAFLRNYGMFRMLPGVTQAGWLGLGFVLCAFFLFLLWISTVGGVKRMHDRGWSGAWYVAWVFVELMFQALDRFTTIPPVLAAVVTLGGLFFFVQIGFLPGAKGPNRFGPDPAQHDIDPGAPAH